VRRLLLSLLAAALLFGAGTWVALEGQEVVVLRTRDASGAEHATRVWVVDDGGVPWVEAGNRARLFYRDLLEQPEVELERTGHVGRYRAVPVPTAEAHARLRSLLRAKYGFADRWINLLVDTADSVAVRLDPR
jgi:hypothetical protein